VESKGRFPLSNSPCCDGTIDFMRFVRIDHLLHLEFESTHPMFCGATGMVTSTRSFVVR
jgi:hypothetical protein